MTRRGESAAAGRIGPAEVGVALVAAACVLVSVSFRIFETDFWQHLLVGRVIWATHSIPHTHLWTWPSYGVKDLLGSWGFSVAVWPFWSIGGVRGLFLWRWITTLLAFGFLWAAARRLGARSLVPLVVLVLCSLCYRQRAQVRPETLVAVFLALEVWILETRRHGGPDRSLWLVPLVWVWVNVHASYHLGFLVLGVHLLDAHLEARGRGGRTRGFAGLWLVALAALAVAFLNPFGWRLLWQPFKFFLALRHDPIMATVGELQRIPWEVNWKNGLPLLMSAWPLLQLWRWRRGTLDRVEALLCVAFTALALSTVRFVGFFALVAAPYLARDADEWLRAWRWPRGLETPLVRAGLAAVACVAVGIPEWSRPDLPLGVGIDWKYYPVRACDFMATAGVRGRAYNTFSIGGYQLFRFWPERDRLPFLDVHPEEADPERRRLYVFASQRAEVWREMQQRYHFDYALLSRLTFPGDRLPDLLDEDPSWALVFMDDAAALFVRRDGPLASIAARHAYRLVPAGNRRLAALGEACRRDPPLRARLAAELERQAQESQYDAMGLSLLANLSILDGRLDAARESLRRAVAADPEDRALADRLRALERRLGP